MINATEQFPPFDAQRAENYLRLRADEELSGAISLAQVQATTDDLATVASGSIERVAALAGALAGIGAVPESVAVSVLEDLGAALVRQHLLPTSELLAGPVAPGRSMSQTVSVLAFPVGVTAESDADGFEFPVRIRFSALVTDGRPARITWRAAYTDPTLTGTQAMFRGPDPTTDLRSLTAADDRGSTYHSTRTTSHGGFSDGGHFRWEGWTELDMAPSAEARWLDVTLAGHPAVRIPLEHPREYAVSVAALDPAGAADRYLDAGSMALLAGVQVRPPGIVAMAGELLAAGVLQPGSASLARLAAVAAGEGVVMPGPLPAITPGRLPKDWSSLLERRRADSGPSGIVFAAAVLPEVEGARCVITELSSRPDISTLRIDAPAWPHFWYHRMPQRDDRYQWNVRDDLGGRYATSAITGIAKGGAADFPLRLHPPINAQARELEITLAGRSSQASVRLPLDWQDDKWDSDLSGWQAES
jgi:hypothetical protein